MVGDKLVAEIYSEWRLLEGGGNPAESVKNENIEVFSMSSTKIRRNYLELPSKFVFYRNYHIYDGQCPSCISSRSLESDSYTIYQQKFRRFTLNYL